MCLLASHRATPPTQYKKTFCQPKKDTGCFGLTCWEGAILSFVQRDCQLGPFFSVLILIGKEERDPFEDPFEDPF